jgi:hypothetical protein
MSAEKHKKRITGRSHQGPGAEILPVPFIDKEAIRLHICHGNLELSATLKG